MNNELMNLYYTYLQNTEVPWQFRRWGMYSIVATLLGRRCYLPFGIDTIHPHMYVILSGLSASRKSVAIKAGRDLIRQAGYTNFAPSSCSREQFLTDMQTGFNDNAIDAGLNLKDVFAARSLTETPAYICCSELIEFIGIKDLPKLMTLADLWDTTEEPKRESFRKVQIYLHCPVVNMLGGITPTNMFLALPSEIAGTGFLSRIIIAHSDPLPDKITFPKQLSVVTAAQIVDKLVAIKNMKGKFYFTPAAETLVDRIYKSTQPLHDARLQGYCGRRLTHLLKLCMVCAAMRLTLEVDVDCVEEAQTILTYTEEGMSKGMGELGDSRNARVIQHVMNILSTSGAPVSLGELYKGCMRDITKFIEFQQIMDSLVTVKKVAQSLHNQELHYIIQRDVSNEGVGINKERWLPELSIGLEGLA